MVYRARSHGCKRYKLEQSRIVRKGSIDFVTITPIPRPAMMLPHSSPRFRWQSLYVQRDSHAAIGLVMAPNARNACTSYDLTGCRERGMVVSILQGQR